MELGMVLRLRLGLDYSDEERKRSLAIAVARAIGRDSFFIHREERLFVYIESLGLRLGLWLGILLYIESQWLRLGLFNDLV